MRGGRSGLQGTEGLNYNARLMCSSVRINAGIAQLVERNLAKVEVGSSSLLSRSRSTGKTVERNQPFSPVIESCVNIMPKTGL